MIRSPLTQCVLLAAFLLLPARAAIANLIVNGSFEGGTTTDAATGDVLPVGWTLGPPNTVTQSKLNIDTAVDAPTDLGPEDQTHYARFQSPATDGSRDCLYQDITTVAGHSYTVSFWVAITSTSVGNTLGLNPVWDENTANQSSMGTTQFYFNPTNTGPVAYQFFSFTETASTNLTRMDFHGIDHNGSILLDNVAVTAVPEPASIAIVGTCLLVGLGRRVRRSRPL